MGKLAVLVVDDEALSADMLASLCCSLEQVGETVSFTSPTEALSHARNHPFQVALLDVDMPSMDGMELASELRKLYPHINIIMTTAYPQYALAAFREDCSGYLLKPISPDNLRHQFDILRFPAESESRTQLRLHCFGNFEVFLGNDPLRFSYAKTKELLAYLADRQGALCTNAEIAAYLWEDDDNHTEYLKRLKRDLTDTVREAVGDDSVIYTQRGAIGIRQDAVSCDLFDFLARRNNAVFTGEYMEQYSWAEERKAMLIGKKWGDLS